MTDLAGKAEFIRQLTGLGFEVGDHDGDRVSFDWVVPCGRYRGQDLRLGFEVPGDFPRTPPHGPHFTPALFPVDTTTDKHPDRVHASAFGADWRQWSRPYESWEITDRSVATYLAYVKALFCILVEPEAATP